MKKATLVFALALTLAACGGASNHENCKDCNVTDSTAVVDTTKVDSVAGGGAKEVTPVK